MVERRHFLQASSLAALGALTSARLAVAAAPTAQRLVFVLLRGGLDGLHALPPYADRDYQRLRPTLAVRPPGQEGGAIDLDGQFGLHPALAALQPLYAAKELLLMPAATTRYRDRSHFDGQNLLENGSGKPFGAADGWLNRAIAGLNGQGGGSGGDRRLGLALGPAVPLILQGDARVQAWARSQLPQVDEDFLVRLGHSYAHDPLFAKTLQDARGSLKPAMDSAAMSGPARQSDEFLRSATAAADLLARPDGPRIAVIESQGWDTHFDQQRRLGRLFTELAQGLLALQQGLATVWSRSAVVVVSEFGRTVAENGSRGTDHGTGGLALLAGGAVAGGRVVGPWPGLSDKALLDGRDLRPLNPYEGLFKSLLIEHLGLAPGLVEDRILPNSRDLPAMQGLWRSV